MAHSAVRESHKTDSPAMNDDRMPNEKCFMKITFNTQYKQ